MDKFEGSVEDLKKLVANVGVSGEWKEIDHGYQFRSKNGAILCWYQSTGRIQFQGPKASREELQRLLDMDEAPSAPKKPPASIASEQRPRVFVVHGHDDVVREQLELVLHKLGIEPFVLANTGGGGLTLIEALEREVVQPKTRARFGIILMTPDDVGYSKRDGDKAAQPRARQNVVLEMGMVLAALGRENVVILKKGHLEIPSDAQGIIYIGFNDHVKETVPKLVDRLQCAGFALPSEVITKAAS